jgi:hypothetical protein
LSRQLGRQLVQDVGGYVAFDAIEDRPDGCRAGRECRRGSSSALEDPPSPRGDARQQRRLVFVLELGDDGRTAVKRARAGFQPPGG